MYLAVLSKAVKNGIILSAFTFYFMNYLNSLLPIFEHYSLLAYSLILILSFFESFAFLGIIVPGTTFVVIIGFLASQGFFNVGMLFVLSVAGAILGDSFSFYLGKHSEKIFKPSSIIFRLSYLERSKNFAQKYGIHSIFLGRFVGPLRAVVPFVAGMFKMDAKKFIFYNVISALLWSAIYLFLGYFFGQAWQAISMWSNRFSVVVFWLAVFLAVLYFLKWLFIKKGKSVLVFFISLIISIGEGVKDNPNIQAFFTRHPALARFLAKRFDRKKFSGLMLTVLVLLAAYTVGSFITTVLDVFVNDSMMSVDLNLENLLHTFRNPLLVKFFLWITLLGNWRIVAVSMLAIVALFWLWNKKNYIFPFLVSVGGGFVTGTVGKYLWHRARPEDVAVYLEKSWSFPSGHSILAVTLYGFLIYFFWKYFKKWKNKINALFLGLLIISLIGFSRLYLGVHYPSDVWAGYLVGFFWLIISVGLVESKNNQDLLSLEDLDNEVDLSASKQASENKPKHLKIITIALLALLAVIYVGYGLKYKPALYQGEEQASIQVVAGTKIGDIFSDYKLPKFTETLLGNPQEPFSFIIIANNDEQLIKSFQQADWFLADNVNFNSLITTFNLEFLNKPYPTAPMTPSLWNTQTNDYGFEQPTEVNSVRYRHHARFWKTNYVTDFNQKIYIGVASLDTGVKWWGLTHRIQPDIDSEREYLFNDLNKEVVKSFEKIQFVDPVLGKNFTGDQFFSDGKAYVIHLK